MPLFFYNSIPAQLVPSDTLLPLKISPERLVDDLRNGQAVQVCLTPDGLDPAALDNAVLSAALETDVARALARNRLSTTESTGLIPRRLRWRGGMLLPRVIE